MITVTEDFSIVFADLPQKLASFRIYSERRLTARKFLQTPFSHAIVGMYVESHFRFP